MSDNPQEAIRPTKRFQLLYGLKKNGQTYKEGTVSLPLCEDFFRMAGNAEINEYKNSNITVGLNEANSAKTIEFTKVRILTSLVSLAEVVNLEGYADKITVVDLKAMYEFETDFLFDLCLQLREESGENLKAANRPLTSESG